MAVNTPGLHRLKGWLAEDKTRTKAWLARQLGVSPPSVHAWLEGNSRPEPPLRKAIEELAGIAADDWWTHADRIALDDARKRRTGTDG